MFTIYVMSILLNFACIYYTIKTCTSKQFTWMLLFAWVISSFVPLANTVIGVVVTGLTLAETETWSRIDKFLMSPVKKGK